MNSWVRKNTGGDWLKVKSIAEQYGWEMVIDAAEKAAEIKEAEQMRREYMASRTKKRDGEARIVMLAQKMGVRLNG